jgi:dTDP-4-dehydrorhamnose reductase
VNKKKIIIVGASGFIGRRLFDKLNKINKYKVIGTYFNNHQKDLINYNHRNEKSTEKLFWEEKPDIIIWCSGLKNLSETETCNLKAIKENFLPIKHLHNYLKNFSKTKFIYISTDYVFSGEKGNYKFDDEPSPNTNY